MHCRKFVHAISKKVHAFQKYVCDITKKYLHNSRKCCVQLKMYKHLQKYDHDILKYKFKETLKYF